MGTLSYCNDYEEATVILGVVAEYIELPQEMMTHKQLTELGDTLFQWVIDNIDGPVVWIREGEFDKTFITFLFQNSEDAIAFKLYWV